MGGGSGTVISSSSFKTLLARLTVLGFILVIMLVATLQSEGNKTALKTYYDLSSSSTDKLQHDEKQVKVLDRSGKSSMVHQQLDLNYMSKRRVPNGPDPIHNRRAGNSGRPPGQA